MTASTLGKPSDPAMQPVETLSKYGDAPHLLQFEPAVWQILCPFRHEADAKTG
ncbi:hypothetical protein FHT93_007170 [Rhizobium sp. BK379]|jgi:hypothetical protein|nr:hypothetical protein [Rhizobium sp. BK379]